MRTAYKFIILLGIGLLLSPLLVTPGPSLLETGLSTICFLGLVAAFITTLIAGFTSWKKSSRNWMYPTLLCVLFILSFIICLKIGIPSEIEKWKFQKHLAAYNKIVDSIQNGNISCSSTITAINTTNLPPGIRNILAVQCPDKSLFVMFIGNGSSFAGHAGYIYKNYTETNNCISENTKLEENENLQPIIGNWYKFYDAD